MESMRTWETIKFKKENMTNIKKMQESGSCVTDSCIFFIFIMRLKEDARAYKKNNHKHIVTSAAEKASVPSYPL